MRHTCWIVSLCCCGIGFCAQADDLSPSELFKSLDQNQDQVLTADEIPTGQAPLFQRLLRIGDADNDGRITPHELTTALQDPRTTSPESPAADTPANHPLERTGPASFGAAMLLFKRLDHDANGRLSREELPEPLRLHLEPVFQKLGRSEISLEEFTTLSDQIRQGREKNGRERFSGRDRPDRAQPQPARPDHPAPPPAFLKILDDDHNGRISKAEMLNAVRLFEQLDHNGDGELDLAEFLGDSRPITRDPGGATPQLRRDGSGELLRRLLSRLDGDGNGTLSRSEMPELIRDQFEKLDANGDGQLGEEELPALGAALREHLNAARPEAPQP